jgi:hypothetical protein
LLWAGGDEINRGGSIIRKPQVFMRAAELGSTAGMFLKNNELHILIRNNRAHRIERFFDSGEDERQVARQEGVAGGANLLRR